MTNIHPFPLTDFAENKLIAAGNIIEELQHVPFSELAQMQLSLERAGIEVSASHALMHIAAKFCMLGEALHNYEQAQEIKRDAAKKGRLRIWMPER